MKKYVSRAVESCKLDTLCVTVTSTPGDIANKGVQGNEGNLEQLSKGNLGSVWDK